MQLNMPISSKCVRADVIITVVWEKFALKHFRRWYDTMKIKCMKYFYGWINREGELFSS